MERQFFSGNTLEQAILAAARHYGLDPSRVAYSLRDKKHGFLNIRRNVVIEVDPEEPELSEEAQAENQVPPVVADRAPGQHRRPAPEDRRPAPENRHREPDLGSWRGEESSWTGDGRENREAEALEEAVKELGGVLGMDLEASIRPGEEGYEIELTGTGSEQLSQDQGSALVAIEHLLPRMMRGLDDRGAPCRVDSGGFRAAHERELTELALEVAAEVQRERQDRRLEPMNPADRRLVHLALADQPTVRTESDGQGFMKRVRIFPS